MNRFLKILVLAGILAFTVFPDASLQAHENEWEINDRIEKLDESVNGFRGLVRNLNTLCEEIKTLKAVVEVQQDQIEKLNKKTGTTSPFRASRISSSGVHCSQW